MEADVDQHGDNQPEHFEIETLGNYFEALEQLIRLTEFYLKKGGKKGFSHLNELIIHHKVEMIDSKLKTNTYSIIFF